jgi:hypothetical protein
MRTAAVRGRRWRGATASALLALVVGVVPLAGLPSPKPPVPTCAPRGEPVVLTGSVTRADAKRYLLLPFRVAPGTTRIEIGYAWTDEAPRASTPLTQTVLDLGLWDEQGYRSVQGFRGWSGSRQGKLHAGQAPIAVQADAADRNYRPGPIRPGVWHAELGVAAVGPSGAFWRVELTCSDPPVGAPPAPDAVDAAHVARAEPGWYHGDFHMHAFHSTTTGPTQAEFVAFARAAQLDFLPVTEYVINRHWNEWGTTQRANRDLLIWPGREIITYFGHANAIGETPSVIDYRHGFEDVTLAEIQRASVRDGALFQVNHPTFFPGPVFENFCRGCEFTLRDHIDWHLVDTIEVLTGPAVVDPSDVDGPETPRGIQNPFVADAIALWEDLLLAGYKVTAVSGSDDKPGPGLGSSATAVYARELSRAGLTEGIRAGHAYVRTRGVAHSPALELTATTSDGQSGIVGDTLRAATAQVRVTVNGGDGQLLRVIRNGELDHLVRVAGDRFTHTFTATRGDDAGPLGTFYRVETLDDRSLTTIANPIFLASG